MPNSAQFPCTTHNRRSILRIVGACLMAFMFVVGQAPLPAQAVSTTCYVDMYNTGGTYDGSSWATAWTDLQAALTSTSPRCNVINVAEGVYKPGTTISQRFDVLPNMRINGGYHTGGVGARDWKAHLTILSGDLAGDDVDADADQIIESASDIRTENSVHVVTMDGTGEYDITDLAGLNGVVVTAGQADEDGAGNWLGGGLYCNGAGAGHACDPVLMQVLFSGNLAYAAGGAISLDGTAGGQSSPKLTDVTFLGNRTVMVDAMGGGGIYASADGGGTTAPTLRNVTFIDNAGYAGGAIFSDAGSGFSNPSVANAIFSGNEAAYGGAIITGVMDGTSNLTLINTSFSTNHATADAGAILISGTAGHLGTLTITNSILYGDTGSFAPELWLNFATATISYSLIQGGCVAGAACDGYLDTDPVYVDAANHDLRVQAPSPTIDSGNSAAVPADVTTDIIGKSRKVDAPWKADTGSGTAPIVDMGAYEYQFACPPAERVYVNVNAAPYGGGTSWADAFQDVPEALTTADYCDAVTDIWVAEGLYVAGTHRQDTVYISGDIGVYGGFGGWESSRDQRDPSDHLTILSGDIGGDDDTNGSGVVVDANPALNSIVGENLYHVVTIGSPSGSNTVLDGFIITGGQANGSEVPWYYGGGLYCEGSAESPGCSPTLRNLYFAGNYASYGGAIYLDGSDGAISSPTLTNVTFRGNYASGDGGALYSDGYNAGVSSPSLTNVTFYKNRGGEWGGAMLNMGATGGTSNPTLNHVTFAENQSDYGGAIYNGGSSGAANPTLTDVILWGDVATASGNEIYNVSAAPTVTHSVVQGGYSGDGNMSTDPKLDLLGINGGVTPTLALLSGSSAIDIGDDTACAVAPANLDQRGVHRPEGAHCDAGAFEFIPPHANWDTDLKTDPVVFEKATGNWFSVGSAAGFLVPALNFGHESGYVPVSGDYDGDHKIDAAVFEKDTGNWFVVGSSLGFYAPALNFGSFTDYIPVPADYDGDGKTDPAVYAKATGNWFVVGSTRGFFAPALGFGNSSFSPQPADYDGDGKTDPAVFQSSTGNWFVLGSMSGFTVPALNFGAGSNYLPVPGDYDGDGSSDPAVFEKSTGHWFVVGSRSGFSTPALSFGGGVNYMPMPGDYDGDGKIDPAVYEISSGNWFAVGSKDGFFAPALGFGNPGFQPVVPAPR